MGYEMGNRMKFNELWFWRIMCSFLYIIVFAIALLLRWNLPRIKELYGFVETNQKAVIQLQDITTMYLTEKIEDKQ